MNQAPQSFIDQCKEARMTDDNINIYWLDILRGVNEDLLKWVINDLGIDEKQCDELDILFKGILNNTADKKMVLDLLDPILNESQNQQCVGKYADLLVEKIEEFYKNLHRLRI